MLCPRCRRYIEKAGPEVPWQCPHCGWPGPLASMVAPWLTGTVLTMLLVALCAGLAWGQWRAFTFVFTRTQVGVGPSAVAHVQGYTLVALHVGAAATPSFNVHFQGSMDGTAWSLHHCQSAIGPDRTEMHTALSTGLWRCNVAGLTFFRAHVTAYVGGATSGHSVSVFGSVMALPGIL